MKLTNKDRAMFLQKFDEGIIKIGDRIPMMHQEPTLVIDDEPKPESIIFDEIEITEKFIQECRYMFNSFVVTFHDRVECARIPLDDARELKMTQYDDYKRHAEDQAVINIHHKGCILLKFDWEPDEFGIANVLYATIGKVTFK